MEVAVTGSEEVGLWIVNILLRFLGAIEFDSMCVQSLIPFLDHVVISLDGFFLVDFNCLH